MAADIFWWPFKSPFKKKEESGTPALATIAESQKTTETEATTTAKEAAAREEEKLRKKKGMGSTILTGMTGVEKEPSVLRKTLGT